MFALKTFKNLTPLRQEEIILAALEEFAFHEYQSASLSNIISQLNLAKGSFYRYFENKQSLYLFLIEHCTDVRYKNDEEYIDSAVFDFFDLMVQHFKAKIQFDRTHPLHSAFLYNVLQEKNTDDLASVQFAGKSKVLASIKKMVTVQVKKNIFRSDIDVDTMAFMVLQTQISIFDYIALKYNVDIRKNIIEKKKLHNISDKKMLKISMQFVEILKNGITIKKI